VRYDLACGLGESHPRFLELGGIDQWITIRGDDAEGVRQSLAAVD
jgi:hypothetical protein